MIHISKIQELLELHKDVSLSFVAIDGRKIHISKARMSSFFSPGNTINIIISPSGEIRTINKYSITEINGEEVVI